MVMIPGAAGSPSQFGSGILGVTDNSSPTAGNIGQVVRSTLLRSAGLTLSNGSGQNVVSVAIPTGGQWLISGCFGFNGVGVTSTVLDMAVTSVSGSFPGADTFASPDTSGNIRDQITTNVGTSDVVKSFPPYMLFLAAGTTLFLLQQSSFSAGTLKAYGFLAATRVSR